MSQPIDIVISFDTTGSMYPCLSEVRRRVDEVAARLFREIPGLRVGIIAHGDYCDSRIYVTKHLQLTNDANAVSYFVKHVEATHGGDAPECYELVLQEARTNMDWTKDSKRLLVMIGDEVPHPVAHTPGKIDWKVETTKLLESGVVVHGVQALNNRHAEIFYKGISDTTGGLHLRLAQFSEAADMLIAMTYGQVSHEAVIGYESEIVADKRMTRSLSAIFDKLLKRDPATGVYGSVDARAVDPARFQKIHVPVDQPITQLVQAQGLVFSAGRGFYEFTKREKIQAGKEVVILDTETGDMFEGSAARDVLGLPHGTAINLNPRDAGFDTRKYKVFVQSTSYNRKLIGGTTFLYEA
jgi:peptidoglycan hydrolase-like protein with peptidoglycan-binding domain